MAAARSKSKRTKPIRVEVSNTCMTNTAEQRRDGEPPTYWLLAKEFYLRGKIRPCEVGRRKVIELVAKTQDGLDKNLDALFSIPYFVLVDDHGQRIDIDGEANHGS